MAANKLHHRFTQTRVKTLPIKVIKATKALISPKGVTVNS